MAGAKQLGEEGIGAEQIETKPAITATSSAAAALQSAETEKNKALQYEVEYILNGHSNDQENLAETARNLLLIREGMNYITLLADQSKRAEAETIAAGIAGFTGNYIVIKLVALCVLAVWAWEESVNDVKSLLKGETVPLISLGDTHTEWLSLTYQDYLRILLAMKHGQTIRYRTMDIIESNLTIKCAGFRMERCVYGISMTIEAQGDSLFLNLYALNRLIPKESREPLYLSTVSYQYE